MATIGHYGKRGSRLRILFVDWDGKRRTLRLGKLSINQARLAKVKVQALLDSRFVGRLDPDTEQWLANLPDRMHARLVAAGLTDARSGPVAVAVGRLCEQYVTDRTDVKTNTANVYRHTGANLVGHFGADKPIVEITEYDAEQWRRYLAKEGLSEATIRKRCGVAKQIFATAVKRKLIKDNPFTCLKSAAIGNKVREYFITQEDTRKLLDACPDSQWRLIIALARFGGLRCPSEVFGLKVSDIDWARSRFLVHASKTARYEGKESRWVPLFPELLPYLRQAFEAAEPGDGYLVTAYRRHSGNLRTRLLRIIKRAGLAPWPRLFQNMRSSRETELAQEHPLHVVVAWIGNSQLVAQKHYLQVRDSDFEKAAQKAAQQTVENPCPLSAHEPAGCDNNADLLTLAAGCRGSHIPQSVPPGAVHE
ncbi:MAG: integrase [Planctomycetes bacterium]|nr:integrase [Planctomycetota bacterium]